MNSSQPDYRNVSEPNSPTIKSAMDEMALAIKNVERELSELSDHLSPVMQRSSAGVVANGESPFKAINMQAPFVEEAYMHVASIDGMVNTIRGIKERLRVT